MLTAAKKAMEKKEYSWAAQLVNYLYRLNPKDEEVRALKTESLRQMAYASTGANIRAMLISCWNCLAGPGPRSTSVLNPSRS